MNSLNNIDKRAYDGLSSSLGHGPAGKAIVDLLQTIVGKVNELVAGNNVVKSGTAVVLNGTDTISVPVGSAFDGKPAVASLAEADGTLSVLNAIWDGSGNLDITLTGNTTAGRLVAWVVDGR